MFRRRPASLDPVCIHKSPIRNRFLFGPAREILWSLCSYRVSGVFAVSESLYTCRCGTRPARPAAGKLRVVRRVSAEGGFRVYRAGEEASAPNASACSWA